jgi:hypothetical protein
MTGNGNHRRKTLTMAYKTRRGKVVRKRLDLTISDLVDMCDVMFEGDHDDGRHGWVAMAANLKGRERVNALFPKAHIAWRDPGGGLPNDWLGFDINLLDVIAATTTKLPMEITRGADLNIANPDALAFLLAYGVNQQGGRAAIWRDGKMEIFVPPAGNN